MAHFSERGLKKKKLLKEQKETEPHAHTPGHSWSHTYAHDIGPYHPHGHTYPPLGGCGATFGQTRTVRHPCSAYLAGLVLEGTGSRAPPAEGVKACGAVGG